PAQQEAAVPAARTIDPAADKMLAMIDQLKTEEARGDPQLLQLNQMLDKIMAIQQREAGGVLPADSTESHEPVQVMTAAPDAVETAILTGTGMRFWGLEEEATPVEGSTGICAVIPEAQTLVSGAIVKLQLQEEVHLGKVTLHPGEYVYGKASLNSERLQVEIPTVKTEDGIVPVKWRLYDMDGLEGIYVPGSIDRDVIRQSGGNGLQSFDLIGGVNPSLSMQAASLGIQTAKTLVGKKAKLIKVHLKAGYQVFIRDRANK
ncbi:MAG: conjugative transposon protein TraM, partial [Agriterribacter sp.]